jgi:ribosome-associated heat shock protein Hsp15
MEREKNVRIDKWLWAVRIYKSRTLATDACTGGKVKINGKSIKPSWVVKPGEVLTVQSGYIKRTYKVLELLEKRVSAKLAKDYIKDITPEEELLKLETAHYSTYISRFRGSGRPTKKDRRIFEKINPYR